MAIESYRAAEKHIANEARAEFFPGLQTALAVLKKAAGPGGLELSKVEELAFDAIQKNSRDNIAYLLSCLVQDVERIDLKVEAFEATSITQQRALNQLVAEAVARAAEAKTRDRVRRIARVVANALRSGQKETYEFERE